MCKTLPLLSPFKIPPNCIEYVFCFSILQVVPDGVGFWEDVLKVRRNHATIRLNRKCDGNQYFLIDDEGQDGANKSGSHTDHIIQVCYPPPLGKAHMLAHNVPK